MNRMRFIPILLVLVALAAISTSPVLAAKGGKGNQEPSITITPNPHVQVSESFLVEGSDFRRTTTVFVIATGPVRYSKLVGTDKSGYFATTWSIDVPGVYTIEACQYRSKGWDCHLGSRSLTVEE